MAQDSRTFFCWGVSHHSAPIEYREQISPDAEQLERLYEQLNAEEWLNELTILSTCNRLEIYGAGYETQSSKIASSVSKVIQVDLDELIEKSQLLLEQQAMEHLFSVTAGLDSQIVGEVEIPGQVKQAFLHAGKKRTVGKMLNKAFQKSFQSTKWIRSNTNIGKGQINVATVAVDLAQKVFGNLRSCKTLIIGAGDIAEKTIAALKSRGVRNFAVCNRTHGKAKELAEATGGIALPFESLDSYLTKADVVLCSTSSQDFILTEPRMNHLLKKRAIRPLCLLDLALPRDIDPGIDRFANVFLYNLDDLAEIAEANLQARKEELGKCHAHIEKKIQHILHGHTPFSSQESQPRGIQQT